MLVDFKFDIAQCEREVEAFGNLLKKNAKLSERDDILPFFKEHLHVSAFVANNVPTMVNYDRIKRQIPPAKDGWLVPEEDEWCFARFETIGCLTAAHIFRLIAAFTSARLVC